MEKLTRSTISLYINTRGPNSYTGGAGPQSGPIRARPVGRRRWQEEEMAGGWMTGPPPSGPNEGRAGWGEGPLSIGQRSPPLIGMAGQLGVSGQRRGCERLTGQLHFQFVCAGQFVVISLI